MLIYNMNDIIRDVERFQLEFQQNRKTHSQHSFWTDISGDNIFRNKIF